MSKPLRGTSREIPTISSASTWDVEVLACRVTLGLVERPERVGIDAARARRWSAAPGRSVFGLGGRIPAGGDDVPRPAQRVRERLLRQRESTGNGDLGTVEHEVVRQLERRPDQPERHGRIEHDEIGAEVVGEVVDPLDHPRVRQQHRLAGAFDAVRLAGVELVGARRTGW